MIESNDALSEVLWEVNKGQVYKSDSIIHTQFLSLVLILKLFALDFYT